VSQNQRITVIVHIEGFDGTDGGGSAFRELLPGDMLFPTTEDVAKEAVLHAVADWQARRET
jgi:hypothetical protein